MGSATTAGTVRIEARAEFAVEFESRWDRPEGGHDNGNDRKWRVELQLDVAIYEVDGPGKRASMST